MRAVKFMFLVGCVLVLAPPTFPHFVKAALGFRLGYSPTEQGYGQKLALAQEKKSAGIQLLSGVNNGGWNNNNGLKAAGSGYGVGLGTRTTRSAQGGGFNALNAISGPGSVRHLRILGLNLYLGGRAAQYGVGQPLQQYVPQIQKKSILGGGGHTPYTGILGTLARPFNSLNLGAKVGAGIKPTTSQAPNGGQDLGGIAGIRASVGSPNYGIGFNLGYKQNLINTKSPLGWALGLGGHNNHGHANHAPVNHAHAPINHAHAPVNYHGQRFASPVAPAYFRGQDQVLVGNGGALLRGHGHANNVVAYAPVLQQQQQNLFSGFPQHLESPIASGFEHQQHGAPQGLQQQGSALSPVASASSQQSTQQRAPNQEKEQNEAQNQQQNIIAQQSVLQPQQTKAPQQQQQQQQTAQQQHQQHHHGRPFFAGPLALGSTMRNNFLSLFRTRPSVLRPTPYQYNFNSPANPQAQGSSQSIRSQQRPQSAPQQNEVPQGWSTLYPINGQQNAASSSFLNPVPANGQSLSKLQASLRPGTVTNVPLNQQQPIGSAQNQVPYVQQPRGYGGFLSQGLRGIFGFGRQPPQQQQHPQQYYGQQQQQQFQRPAGAQGGPGGAQGQPGFGPQGQFGGAQFGGAQFGGAQFGGPGGASQQAQPQDYNLFSQQLPNPFQGLQNFQNSPFFQSSVPEQPGQSAQGSNNNAQTKQQGPVLPFLPQFPFTADSPSFQAHPAFRYSHSTHSKPVNMGAFTVNMDVTNSAGGTDPSGSASSTPIYGPGGRRIKKTKKARGDIIIMKKHDTEVPSASAPKSVRQLPLDIMETAASSNQITLSSSLGATSWTPMVVVDPPKLARKSLEAPVSASVQVVDKKPIILSSPKIRTPPSRIASPSSSLSSSSPSSPERTMILRKRRLNELEASSSPTVVPTSAPTTSAPTTTTTTVAPSTTSPSSSPVPSSTVPAVTTTEVSA